jgi:hypothetical protein
MTDKEVFESLQAHYEVEITSKEQARKLLLKRIKSQPAWLAVLSEQLLDKLKIKHDMQFDDVDRSVAAAVKGKLIRRIIR